MIIHILWGVLVWLAFFSVCAGILILIDYFATKQQLKHKSNGFGYGDYAALRNDFSIDQMHIFTAKRAFVACLGTDSDESKLFSYRGYHDCKSLSMMYGGDNACQWGCLGLGDCASVCSCNAITIHNGVAVIGETCIGCGDCLHVCPQHIISLIPDTADYMIPCSSRAGSDTSLLCNKGCTACGKCSGTAGYAGYKVDQKTNHAYVDYSGTGSREIGMRLCPSSCICETVKTEKKDFKKYRFWIMINAIQSIFKKCFSIN